MASTVQWNGLNSNWTFVIEAWVLVYVQHFLYVFYSYWHDVDWAAYESQTSGNSFTKILTQFSNPVLPDKSFWFKHPSNICTFCCSDNLFSFTKSYYTFLLAICYMIMSVKWSFFWLIQCDIPTRSQLYVQWCVIRIRVEITNFKLMKITKISTVSTPYKCDAFFCCI